MNIEKDTIETLKFGYIEEEQQGYRCLVCHAFFQHGEVYPVKHRFFTAEKAMEHHMQEEHPDYVESLIFHDSRYNMLTENQKQMMRHFRSGKSDKEIAQLLQLSPSTVRHQKFMFREKWKQAKLYMAIYENVFASPQDIQLMEIHETAPILDDRFMISEEEKEKILSMNFQSISPLKLKSFPGKEKKKIVILTKICEQFEKERKYTEKEVNQILEEIYDDYVTLRRYLIEYRFFDRAKDGSSYWLC